MRLVLLLFLFLAGLSACLKSDILDRELIGSNFKESEFYTSGAFENEFELEVVELELIPVNDTLCRPLVTFKLPNSYSGRLAEVWTDGIEIVFFDNSVFESVTYPLEPDFQGHFTYDYGMVKCQFSQTRNLRIELIDPNTGRVSAFTERIYSIQF